MLLFETIDCIMCYLDQEKVETYPVVSFVMLMFMSKK